MNRISWWYTEIGEAEKNAVLQAFENKTFTQGPVSEELEALFAEALEVPYTVVTTSGTVAISMALMASEIGPGDEVIVPALTWIATGNAAAFLGARVVLVDCLSDLPLIDSDEVRKRISSKTRAIIPVHLNGKACRLDELLQIADDAGAVLIEDACKAMMSRTETGYMGTLGEMGCYSLGMISLVSTGYGGLVVTRKKELYQRLKVIQNQGVPRWGEEAYIRFGHNFKLSDVLAAMGVAQIARIEEKLNHVQAIYKRYVEGIAEVPYLDMIEVGAERGEVSLCAEVRSPHREEIIAYLEGHEVEPLRFHLPLQCAAYFGQQGEFPNAKAFADEGFILPCGPAQPMENVDRCIGLLQKWKPGE